MAFDLTSDGIAKLTGAVRAGEYVGTIEEVATSNARGGGKTWHIHWKLDGITAPFVDDLLVSSIGRCLAPAWHRIADILAANGRPLTGYAHEGAIMRQLVGCHARLVVAADPLNGETAVVAIKPAVAEAA